MSTTTLREFQRAVKAKIDELRHYSPSVIGQAERDLGLDNFIDDQEVTVRVTVPAADPATAASQVQGQLDSLYLPTGWSATVNS